MAGIIVQRQVGAWKSAPHPAFHATVFRPQCLPHDSLRCFTVGPGGSRRYIPFTREPFPQILVRPRHVPRQRMPAALLIAPQIVSRRRSTKLSRRPGLVLPMPALRGGARSTARNGKQSGQEANFKIFSSFHPSFFHRFFAIPAEQRKSPAGSFASIRKPPSYRTPRRRL